MGHRDRGFPRHPGRVPHVDATPPHPLTSGADAPTLLHMHSQERYRAAARPDAGRARDGARSPRLRRGFSLVELLVVIGILALLLGILLPALSGVRQSGRVSGCLSNLRQIALAHASYMNAHEGYFVDAGLPHGSSGGGAADELSWANQLRPYLGARDYDGETDEELAARELEELPMLRSPLDTSPHWPPHLGGTGGPVEGDRYRRSSYAFNDFLSRRYSPYVATEGAFAATDRLGRVPSPNDTVQFAVLAFEGEYAASDHVHVVDLYNPVDPVLLPRIAARQMQIDAAGGPPAEFTSRSNYAFLDGSVATRPFADVFLPPADMNGDGLVVGASDFVNRFDPRSAGRVTAAAAVRSAE